MGLLDRLKKKSSSSETTVSIDNEQTELDADKSLIEEQDLFLDSDSEEDLDEFDSLESEDSDTVPLDNQIKSSKTNTRRWVAIGLVVFLVLATLTGIGLWYYLFNRTFPMAEDLTNRFFNALSKGKHNTAYSMMDKPYREEISNNDFRFLLRASAFYFDNIIKVDFGEKDFESFEEVATLNGSIEYVGKASGEFELNFIVRKIGKQEKLFITGFQISSEDRRKREEKASHKAVIEFLGTFSKERANVFEGFFHPKRLELWGLDKRLKLLKLHSRLVDFGFVEHSFKPTDFKAKSNVERVYFGKSETKSGNKMSVTITVFYEKGTWFISDLNFKPQ